MWYRTVCVAAILGLSTAAHAAVFTLIGDTTAGYSAFSMPSVNSSGVVAFNATTGGTAKIFTGANAPATLAFDPTTAGLFPGLKDSPTINDSGQIAFMPGGFSTRDIYRLNTGGTLTHIFDGSVPDAIAVSVTPGAVANIFFFRTFSNLLPRAGAFSGDGVTQNVLISMSQDVYHDAGRIAASPSGQWAVNATDFLGHPYHTLIANGSVVLLCT